MADGQDWELETACRRIEQLEAALSRRTELLEQKQSELLGIKASKAYRLAHRLQTVVDRTFPLHSRRRTVLKQLAGWIGRRGSSSGSSTDVPSDRFALECVPSAEYQRWIACHEPTARELAEQTQEPFARTPIISVVVPVFNPPAEFLQAMLDSVFAQTYPHWQLCLADASTQPHVRPILERVAADRRVKIVWLTSNRGIVGNSNAALELVSGEFAAFLDHDDTLAPFALFELAKAVDREPTADVLYSDEDKLNLAGERVEPFFKPDWSPETLRSRNYVCHLAAVRRTLLDQIGGFREGFDGAQDHDLFLRATETARKTVHIPKILYHWRMHRQSTAADAGSKGYAHDAGKRAVAEHLVRVGLVGQVHDGGLPGLYRPTYVFRSNPLVSVIVPNRDAPELLQACVDSVLRGGHPNVELLIVENGSTRPETFGYYRELAKRPNVRILDWTKPFNYAAVNNFAAAQSRGELLLFLNNDVDAITPDWLEKLVAVGLQPGVGAVGAKLYYADDTIQHAGIVLGMGGIAGHGHLNFPRHAPGHMQRLRFTQNVSAVTGACLLSPAEAFRKIGGFDEGFVLAFNDVDYCLQLLEHGYRVVWTPDAELYHFESKTRGYEDTPEKQRRFKREYDLFQNKWAGALRNGDRYYSPHFRLDRPDFALKVA